MRDRPVIYGGLLLYVVFFTFPVWWGLAGRTTTKGPQQALPARAKDCVAPIAYMKTSHMKLLVDRRDKAVRGWDHSIQLTATCLTKCHGEKAEFCDRCHTYAGVSPTCWNCHLDTKAAVILRSAR